MSRRALIGFLLLYAGFVAYGSLAPFDFSADAEQVRLNRWRAWQFWPIGSRITPSRTDLASNVLLYVPLGLLGSAAWRAGRRENLLPALLLPTLAGGALSVGIELLQVYTPTRVAGAHDVLANLAGSFAGAWLGLVLAGPIGQFLDRFDARRRGLLTAAFLYLLLLLADGWYPFLPTLDVSQVVGNLRNSELRLGPALAEHSADHWLIWRAGGYGLLTAMLAAAEGRRDGRWRKALAVTALLALGVELAKPFIQGRRFNLANVLVSCAGGLAITGLGGLLDRRRGLQPDRPLRIRLALLWGAVTLAGLSFLLRSVLRSGGMQYDSLGLFAPSAPSLATVLLAGAALLGAVGSAGITRLARRSFRLGLSCGGWALLTACAVWLVLLGSGSVPSTSAGFVLYLAAGLLLAGLGGVLVAEWIDFGRSAALKMTGLLMLPALGWLGAFTLAGWAVGVPCWALLARGPIPGELPAALLALLAGAGSAVLSVGWQSGGSRRLAALLAAGLLGLPGWALVSLAVTPSLPGALPGGASLADLLSPGTADPSEPFVLLVRWSAVQFAVVALLAVGRGLWTAAAGPPVAGQPTLPRPDEPARSSRHPTAGSVLMGIVLAGLIAGSARAEPPESRPPVKRTDEDLALRRALDLQARQLQQQAAKDYPGYHTAVDRERRLVYVSAIDRRRLGVVMGLLARYGDIIRGELFAHQPRWNVTVLLPTVHDFRQLVDRPGVFGVYIPDRRTLASVSFSNVLIHEYVHALHHVEQAALGQVHAIWLVEGLAMLYQHCRFVEGQPQFRTSVGLEALQKSVRQNKATSLGKLLRLDHKGFMKQPEQHYALAHALLLYLHDREQLQPFYEVYVKTWKQDPTGEEALRTVFGRDTEIVELDFKRWLARQEPPWQPARSAKAYLGLRLRDASRGVQVTGFAKRGPAGQTGVLEVGDVLISIAGVPVETVREVAPAIRTARPGEIVTIEILRRGKPMTLRHVVGALPSRRQIDK